MERLPSGAARTDAITIVRIGEPMDIGNCKTARIVYRFPRPGASNNVENGSSGRLCGSALGLRAEHDARLWAEVAGRSRIPRESGDSAKSHLGWGNRPTWVARHPTSFAWRSNY